MSVTDGQVHLNPHPQGWLLRIFCILKVVQSWRLINFQADAALHFSERARAFQVGRVFFPSGVPAVMDATDRGHDFEMDIVLDDRLMAQFERGRAGRPDVPDERGAYICLEIRTACLQQARGIEAAGCTLGLPFAREGWESILKAGGYSPTLLHRFPPLHQLTDRNWNFRPVVVAFTKAEEHFLAGRSTEAVGKCRDAIFLMAKNLGYEDFDRKCREDLAKKRTKDESKARRIEMLWQSIYLLTHLGHHPDLADLETPGQLPAEFSPDEARFALDITAATLHLLSLRPAVPLT